VVGAGIVSPSGRDDCNVVYKLHHNVTEVNPPLLHPSSRATCSMAYQLSVRTNDR